MLRIQSLAPSAQNPAYRVQYPESRVQRPESRVQHPESSVQSPASRVQRPESSVQLLRLCPESRNSGMPISWLFTFIYYSIFDLFLAFLEDRRYIKKFDIWWDVWEWKIRQSYKRSCRRRQQSILDVSSWKHLQYRIRF